MAYSLDLHNRVIEAVRKGEQTKEDIAERFVVSISTINRWLRRDDLLPQLKQGMTMMWDKASFHKSPKI